MMGARRALLLTAIVVLGALVVAGEAYGAGNGPGQDAHFFLMTAEASGEYTADYGDERLEPGLTTSFGVDGYETGSWSWQIRAVGRAIGNGPLKSAAAEFKGSSSHDVDIISYLVLMSVLSEDHLCVDSAVRRELISYSLPFGASGPFPGTSPQWISSPDTSIQFRQGGFEVGYPSNYNLVQHCYHGLPPALQLYSLILPSETPVPNGTFNPRSDRHFKGSWQDSVSVTEAVGGPSEHLDTGSTELEITVKSVSERKAKKKRDKYRDPDPQDGIYTTDSF